MPVKKHFGFWILSLLVLFACKTKTTHFHLTYNAEIEVAEGREAFVSVLTPEIKTNCRVRFERNNTKRSKVRKVYLKHFTLTNVVPNGKPLPVLDAAFISSPDYPERKISFRKSDGNAESLTFDVIGSADDLQDYIKQDRFSMRFSFVNKGIAEGKIQVKMDFLIEGELIKTNLFHKILV